MGAIATFDYQAFLARYPEFRSQPESFVQEMFADASIIHANDGSGPVKKESSQLRLLNMVTAHLLQLFAPNPVQPTGIGSPQLVGAINNASEGSVSVGTQNDYPPGSPQWWQQTKYGSEYWLATTVYRTMRYFPSPGRNMNPFFPLGSFLSRFGRVG